MKILTEIIIFIAGWVIIILVSVWILMGPIDLAIEIEDDNSLACKFPCKFPGPVYRLAVESAKYEYLKTIKRKGG